MSSMVDVVEGLGAAVDAAREVDLHSMTPAERGAFLAALEAQAARFGAVQVALLDVVDRGGLHHCDGIRNARTHLRYHAHLSYAEASARSKLQRALRDLDEVRAAYEAGQIGTCQARRFARTWANPRVREALVASQGVLLAVAVAEQFPWFDRTMTEWERRADPDGTVDADAISQRAALTRLFDGTWEIGGRFNSATGVVLDQILSHYAAAELAADWAAARAEHGDAATEAHLPRTAAERRADAVVSIFLDAASTPPGGRDPKIVLNLLMTWDEYQREVTRLAADDRGGECSGDDIERDTDAGGDPDHDPGVAADDESIDLRPHDTGHVDPHGYEDDHHGAPQSPPTRPPGWPTAGPFAGPVPRCGTLDGVWIDPWDAVKLSVGAHLRRVVIGTDGTVIDLGRAARFFTGSARDAVMLASPRCVWAACDTPTSRCQADHLVEHRRGGATDPANGAPLCGHHNRLKNHRFRVWRDPAGTWHTVRPDGTEV